MEVSAEGDALATANFPIHLSSKSTYILTSYPSHITVDPINPNSQRRKSSKMSFFGKKQSAQSAPDVQNIHPVNSTLTGYGELSPEDTKVGT